MNSSYNYAIIKLSIFFVAFFFSSLPAHATPPQRLILSSLSLVHEKDATYANFSVTIDDEEGLSDMLKNGSNVELAIAVHVERKRSWWENSVVNKSEYICTLTYQILTRDFVLSLPNDTQINVIRDKRLSHLLEKYWYRFHLQAVTSEQLKKQPRDRDYEVEVRVSTHYKEIPPWLEKNSLFWSADIVPEEKISAVFHY